MAVLIRFCYVECRIGLWGRMLGQRNSGWILIRSPSLRGQGLCGARGCVARSAGRW